MMSKLDEILQLREITAGLYRHPELIDRHPELGMVSEIVKEVEEKILSRGQVTLARREVT